jgi:preprotein translocase subunit YajC
MHTLLISLPQSQDTSIRYRDGSAPAPAPGPNQGAPNGTTTGTQQPPPAGGPQDPMAGCYGQLPIFLAIGLMFYFLILRPQQKQEKARKLLLSKIGKGDRVVTNSGIHGVIAGIADDIVQLRIDSEGKVKITVDRAAIGRVLSDEPTQKAAAAKETNSQATKD